MELFTEGNEAGTGMFIGMISTIAFFTTIILSLYFFYRARNKERMALIEKGADASEIFKKRTGGGLLKYGLFIIGLGIGIFFSYLFSTFTSMDPVVSYFTFILLFGGGALILAFFLAKKEKMNG